MQWTFPDGTFVSGPKARFPVPGARIAEGAGMQDLLGCAGQRNTGFLPGAQDHRSIVTRIPARGPCERSGAEDARAGSRAPPDIDFRIRRRNVGSAERQYSVPQRVLRDRLDVSPMPETATAIDALKANRADPTTKTGKVR